MERQEIIIDADNRDERRERRGMVMHGLSGTPEYMAWHNMVNRCTNPNDPGYHRYGGRGIRVCDQWKHSFPRFLSDVGARPSKRHSLDRIDNSKSYQLGNVRWATRIEQQQNLRTNVKLTYNGETLCLREWARRCHISHNTITKRLRAGSSVENALRPTKKRSVELRGVCFNKRMRKWQAYGPGRLRLHIGTFSTEQLAIEAARPLWIGK